MAESLKRKIEGTEEVGFIEKLKDALGLIPLKKKYLAKAEHVALPWEEEKKPVVRTFLTRREAEKWCEAMKKAGYTLCEVLPPEE